MFRQSIRTAVLFLMCALFSANLFAESAVLLSTDGEGAEKALVDKVLAEELEAHPDYELKATREIGIGDLIVGAGCESPDAACMSQLGGLINADRLVFAKLGEGTLSIQIFDFQKKEFLDESKKTKVNTGDEESVRGFIRSLLYGDTGKLFVDVGPESAEIFLNGETQGMSPQTLTDLPLGKHTLLIRAADGSEQTREIVLEAGKVERVSFTIAQAEKGGGSGVVKFLPAIGTLAIGVAGMAFGVIQSLEVQGYKDDLAAVESKGVFADGIVEEDELADLEGSRWRQIHDQANGSSAETLQWVGYGVGAIGLGLGTYLLYSALGDSTEVAISPDPSNPSASVRIKF